MNLVAAPHSLQPQHLSEWISGSGVTESITHLNARSICCPKEIAQLLNWGAYQGTPGVIVHSPLRKSKRKLGQSARAMSIH